MYRFRYRAKNCQGWSQFSPELYAIAAQKPTPPPPLELISTSSTFVSLQLFPSADNMGAVVTSYTIYRNNGQDDQNWTELDGYSFLTDGYIAVISNAVEGIVAGRYYSFVYKATNRVGSSNLSTILTVPVADVPAVATAPQLLDHDQTSITVSWNQVVDTQLPAGIILGYKLYMDNGYNEDYVLIFNGVGFPDITHFKATGLVTGQYYRFYVQAENVVGVGSPSPPTYIYACADPSGIEPPELVGLASSTSLSMKWSEPQSSGGCAITSYSILRDGGPANPTFTLIHEAEISNKPSLRNFVVTDLPSNVLGEIVKFKIRVTNQGGFAASSCEYLSVVVADVPSDPA